MQKYFVLMGYALTGKTPSTLHSVFYLASDVDARIAELERGLRNLLALIDEIDTSSGEEVKGIVYYEAKKLLTP